MRLDVKFMQKDWTSAADKCILKETYLLKDGSTVEENGIVEYSSVTLELCIRNC